MVRRIRFSYGRNSPLGHKSTGTMPVVAEMIAKVLEADLFEDFHHFFRSNTGAQSGQSYLILEQFGKGQCDGEIMFFFRCGHGEKHDGMY